MGLEGGKSRRNSTAPIWLSAAIVGAGLLVYANALLGPFIFDDVDSISDNQHIRTLWPLGQAMSAPPQGTLAGRPIVSLSLAFNYAVGGLNVWGYHAVNVAIHLLSALLLFGIVRRTLLSPGLAGRWKRSASWLAAVSAAIWVVHPLQTEAVTYVVQRTELLMGLFYLLTLYCAIRGWQGSDRRAWFAGAVVSCALGMGSKEVMVSAPLVVLLYDRTFVSGSFGASLRNGRGLYAGLAVTWLVLAWMNLHGPRSETVGLRLGVAPMEYLETQAGVILWYLRLSLWPHPLAITYDDWPIAARVTQFLPQGLIIMALLAGAFWRRSPLGFLGVFFFMILAPTSTFVPIVTEFAAERRMYLPLGAVVVLVVIGGYRLLVYLSSRLSLSASVVRGIGAGLTIVAMAALCCATVARNRDYASAIGIWGDTVAKRPGSATAHFSLADALMGEKRYAEAIEHCNVALRIKPNSARAHNNLGAALLKTGRVAEALPHFEDAVRCDPSFAMARVNLANVLAHRGRTNEAMEHLAAAVRIEPDSAFAHTSLGVLLAGQNRPEDAIAQHRAALRLNPTYAEAYNNLGAVLASQRRPDQAVIQYTTALRIKPDLAEAHVNLAQLLTDQKKYDEAIVHYMAALRIKPACTDAHSGLGHALARQGKPDEAIVHYREALRLSPDSAQAYGNLAEALADQGRFDEAIRHYRDALRFRPDYAEVHNNLGAILSRQGKYDDAIRHYSEALRLKPGCPEAHSNLAAALALRGKPDEAIAEYSEALRLRPAYSKAHQKLASLLLERGRIDEAIQHYNDALAVDRRLPSSWIGLGHAYRKQGRGEQAVAAYREAVKLAPGDPAVHFVLGLALHDRGKFDEAVEQYQQVLRIDSHHPGVRERLEAAQAGRGTARAR